MRGQCGQVPEGADLVGGAMRGVGLPRSKWANRFKIPRGGTPEKVIASVSRLAFAVA